MRRGPKPRPLAERFWPKVLFTDGCWIWQGAIHSGYGHISEGPPAHRKSQVPAHRVAYTLLVGPIPDGLDLDHLCRNTKCVNPHHLEPVTPTVNKLRGFGVSALNAAKMCCPKGHPYDRLYRGRRWCTVCINQRKATKRSALRLSREC